MEFTPYSSKRSTVNMDSVLNATDYAVTAAGALGVDVSTADAALLTAQASRLLFAPESVSKPQNEQAKLVASTASLFFTMATGNRRTASFLELIAKGIIDLTIHR